MQIGKRESASSDYFAASLLLILVFMEKAFYFLPSAFAFWMASRSAFRRSYQHKSPVSWDDVMHLLGEVLFLLALLATIMKVI